MPSELSDSKNKLLKKLKKGDDKRRYKKRRTSSSSEESSDEDMDLEKVIFRLKMDHKSFILT